MQEGYGNSTGGYAGNSTAQGYTDAPKRQRHVLDACGMVENEQEFTAKLLEELEASLQGVLSAPTPEPGGNVTSGTQALPPLASQIIGVASRQSRFNNQLRSIITRLEI